MSDLQGSSLSFYGRVTDDLRREPVVAGEVRVTLGSREAIYKVDGHFAFADVRPSPLPYDVVLGGGLYQGRTFSKAFPGPAPVEPPSPTAAPSPGRGDWHHDAEVSWYGPGFYGLRTACGETLTTSLIGVASRTLPCGTLVTFRNPADGRVVTAPVVDRGPYVSGRQWDLTGGLCLALVHCYTGSIDWHL